MYQIFEEVQGWNLDFKPMTPKYITGTYFDTTLSMFGLLPSATQEEAESSQKGPKGPPALRRS